MEQFARVVWSRVDGTESDGGVEDVPEGLGDLKVMVELLAAGNGSETALIVSNHDSVLNYVGERSEADPQSQTGPETQGKEAARSNADTSDKRSQDPTEFVQQHRAQLVVKCPSCSTEHACKHMRPGQNGYVCGHCSALFLVNTCLDGNLPGAGKRKCEEDCSSSSAETSRNHKRPRQESRSSTNTCTLEPNQDTEESENNSDTVDSQHTSETGISNCGRPVTSSSVTLSTTSDENQNSPLFDVPKEENNLGEGCYSRVSTSISHNCESQEEMPGNPGSSYDPSASPDCLQTSESPGCISDPYYTRVLIDPTKAPVSKFSLSTQTSWPPERDTVTVNNSATTLTRVSQSTELGQSSNNLFNTSEPIDCSYTPESQVGYRNVRDGFVTPTAASEGILSESNSYVTERNLPQPTPHASTVPNITSHTAVGTQNNIPAGTSRNENFTGPCHATASPSLPQVSAANGCLDTSYGSKITTDVQQVSGTREFHPDSYRFSASTSVTQEVTNLPVKCSDSCVTTGIAPSTLLNASLQENGDDNFIGKHSTQSKVFNKSNTGSSNDIPSASNSSSNCRPSSFNLLSFEPKQKSLATEDNDLPSAKELEKFLTEFRLKRTELQLSQTAVCRTLSRLYGSGFEQSTLSRFESGQLKLRSMLQKKRQIAEALKVLEDKSDENDMEETSSYVKKRRSRAVFDFKVKESLERYYSQNQKPSRSELASIGDKLNLQKDVVRVWFCNRRAKEKQEPSKSANIA